MDTNADKPAPSRIALSYPQVFSRESLINDRIRESDYLDQMLAKSVDEQFVPQLRRDLTAISSLAVQLGISFDAAAKINFRRGQELDDLRQEIEVTKLRAELQRVQTQLQQLQSGSGTGPASPSTTTPGSASTIDMQAAKDQLAAVLKSATDALNALKDLAKGARKTDIAESPEERFRDLQAYRGDLRAALNAAKLDDVHDRDGNALYRMQFAATVFPGAPDSTSRKWGIARVEVNRPKLTEIEIQRLYLRWLGHTTERMNTVDREGNRVTDLQYAYLINNAALASIMAATTSMFTPAAGNTPPMLIAVHPDYLADIKWLLLDKRYDDIDKVVTSLKRFLVEPPTLSDAPDSSAFNGALDAALKRDDSAGTCTFMNDPGLDVTGLKFQVKDAFAYTQKLALAYPFLQAGLHSALNVVNGNREALARQQSSQPRQRSKKFFKENIDSLYGATAAAGDLLWAAERLFLMVPKGCRAELEKLYARQRTIEVPCGFRDAVVQGTDGCPRPALPESSIASSAGVASTAKSTLLASAPGIVAKGAAVVYSVAPGEQAQRLSSVASAANSVQMALGLAAGMPASGVGLQAGLGHLKSAVGNAEALERLPLVVGFSEQEPKTKVSRFGWVFGPQSYIKIPQRGEPSISLRHVVTTYQTAVDISVPVWWPRLNLEIKNAWVPNTWESDSDPLANAEVTQNMEINRPISIGDLDSLTGYLLRAFSPFSVRPVRIDRVEPNRITLCDGEITFLVYGLNLWRNPQAFFLGRKASGVVILPDMQGISATFTLSAVQKVAFSPQALVVWTQSGPAEQLIDLHAQKEECPGKPEAKAPSTVKVTFSPASVKDLPWSVKLTLPSGDLAWPETVKLTAKIKGQDDIALEIAKPKRTDKTYELTLQAKDAEVQKIFVAAHKEDLQVQFGVQEGTAKDFPSIENTLKIEKAAAKPGGKPPAQGQPGNGAGEQPAPKTEPTGKSDKGPAKKEDKKKSSSSE
jgi:hypothetical protein